MEPGYIKINLEQVIKDKGFSKNKFAHMTMMERTQLNNYCKGKMQRFDLVLLARMCDILDCQVGDILEYVKNEEE
ncbi:MAG: helix-turn-helix transcriptional regulator [Clostridia bacterium]|nr:helix-turn-helix transcriptional regulator [Clostridia bacterium]